MRVNGKNVDASPATRYQQGRMPRRPTGRPLRGKLNLTIHPEIRVFADELAAKRRRSVSQLFEDLIEAEWNRKQPAAQQAPQYQQVPPQAYQPAPGYAQPVQPAWSQHAAGYTGGNQ